MIFINDLAADCAWLDPAPIGIVEPGWVSLVGDMLRDIGAAVATRPGTTIDVLAIAERDGELLFDALIDGAGADDAAIAAAVESAAAQARTRAAATCARCGRAGLLCHRSGLPAVRCDRHAGQRTAITSDRRSGPSLAPEKAVLGSP